MNRPITDVGVAGLAVHEGRAELLEEIMSLTVEHPETEPETGRRHRRVLPVLAAAAAVVAIAAGLSLPRLLGGDDHAVVPAPFAAPTRGTLAVLDQPGWSLVAATVQPSYGSLSYENGDRELEIRWKAAELHGEYVADRERIDAPAVDAGVPVTVLGSPGRLWAYSADDHTVIREPDGDVFLEFRGSGMGEPAYRRLLDTLISVAAADLDAHLPDAFVTAPERDDAIAHALAGVPLPDGFDADAIETTEVDPYQLGAAVSGAVTCAWIEDYVRAQERGDQSAMAHASDALATSRQWPVLKAMDAEGDYPEVVWEISADIGRGKVPEEYQQGLGCD